MVYELKMNIRWVSLEKNQTEMMVGMLFSHSFVSDSLQPHGLQHTRLPCPSLSPRSCSNSCPLSRWCHPTSSSSVVPFSSCLQFSPASGSFLVSWLFTSDGQSIGVSASASVLPMNIQCWFWKVAAESHLLCLDLWPPEDRISIQGQRWGSTPWSFLCSKVLLLNYNSIH